MPRLNPSRHLAGEIAREACVDEAAGLIREALIDSSPNYQSTQNKKL